MHNVPSLHNGHPDVTHTHKLPVVMTLSGLDATGGAGLQADIEALISMGCHASPVATALTVQDTQRVFGYQPVDAMLLIQQARAVLEDMPVAAFKIGMVGSVANAEAIHSLLTDYPDIPVVVDPVLTGGGGGELSEGGVLEALRTLLIPQATVLTPNTVEARQLAPEADNLNACAQQLLEMGSRFVLLTGTHENTHTVDNQLYTDHRRFETFSWDRLPAHYHGSGCTLAAAIAGSLAQGLEPFTAVHEAQEYTWQSLQSGYRQGMGQLLPNRLYWARDEAQRR